MGRRERTRCTYAYVFLHCQRKSLSVTSQKHKRWARQGPEVSSTGLRTKSLGGAMGYAPSHAWNHLHGIIGRCTMSCIAPCAAHCARNGLRRATIMGPSTCYSMGIDLPIAVPGEVICPVVRGGVWAGFRRGSLQGLGMLFAKLGRV